MIQNDDIHMTKSDYINFRRIFSKTPYNIKMSKGFSTKYKKKTGGMGKPKEILPYKSYKDYLRRKRAKNAVPRRLKMLEKKIRNNEGILTYRRRAHASYTTSGNNTCLYSNVVAFSTTIAEQALAEMRFFDPSAPGTYIQANLATGTNQKQTMMKVSSSVVYRNNYSVPCILSVYVCTPKADTNIPPINAIVNGFADVGGISNTDPQTFPSDSNQFNDLYKVKKSVLRKELKAGQQVVVKYSPKDFVYDPSYVDSHNLLYQRKLGAHLFLSKIEGIPTHDAANAALIGTSQAGLDIMINSTIKITYDAGVDMEFFVNSSNAVAMTTPNISQLQNEQANYAI